MARLLLNSRLERVEELREERRTAAENEPVGANLSSIRDNRTVRQMRLIQKLRQRAQQGRLDGVDGETKTKEKSKEKFFSWFSSCYTFSFCF